MVRRDRTRIVLGTRETPSFVSREFYEAMEAYTSIYQYDIRLRPNTVRYRIPAHMVVERIWNPKAEFYEIDVDDSLWVPTCHRRTILDRKTYVSREPKSHLDRFQIYTEEHSQTYYLLTPNAKYYDTSIYIDWSTRFLLYNNIVWRVDMKQVHCDPHNTAHTSWFFSHPKYSVELTTNINFNSGLHGNLLEALNNMLPRAFRCELELV